jgi:hypothetical protein
MTTPRSLVLSCFVTTLAGVAAAAHAQCPPVRSVSPDGADAVRFGQAMASNTSQGGNQWVISEQHQVWAYDLVDGRLVQRQDVRLPYPYFQNQFGYHVAIDGHRMVAGASMVRWPGRIDPVGGAFVFELVDGQWIHTGDVEPPDGLMASGTGGKVAIDGDTILTAGDPHGRVVVSEPAPGQPTGVVTVQVIQRPDDVEREAEFGWPVVARDGWLFISAHRDRTHTSMAGVVFAYRRGTDGTYELVQRIDGHSLGVGDEIGLFGLAVGFDGRTLAIGAGSSTIDFEQQGAVFVYELDSGLWTRTQTLTPHTAFRRQAFGIYQVAVDGDRLIVHANGQRTARVDGAVYAFERTAAGVWRQSARLLPNPPYHAADYGYRMALHGDLALIGAYRECEGPGTDATGAAYLFDLSCYECPDLDADDRLTVFDSLEFLRAFDAGEPIADMDNDGELTVADFLAFQDAFAVGCP